MESTKEEDGNNVNNPFHRSLCFCRPMKMREVRQRDNSNKVRGAKTMGDATCDIAAQSSTYGVSKIPTCEREISPRRNYFSHESKSSGASLITSQPPFRSRLLRRPQQPCYNLLVIELISCHLRKMCVLSVLLFTEFDTYFYSNLRI